MSKATTLQDILKSLPRTTSTESLDLPIFDADGVISKIYASTLLNVGFNKSLTGANIASLPGIWLIVAYSQTDVRKYYIGIYIMIKSGDYATATFIPLASAGITGIWNQVGTVSCTGADDIIYIGIRFKAPIS